MEQKIDTIKPPGYGIYVTVWLALLGLLAATVTLARLNPLHLAAVWSMTISVVKALLVLLFFMHLRYEKWYFRLMVTIPLIVLAIFIALTFADTYFRY